MNYFCEQCGRSFTRTHSLKRHQQQSCVERWAVADVAAAKRRILDGASTSRANDTAPTIMLNCNVCNVTLPLNDMLAHQRTLAHRRNCCVSVSPGVERMESAFKNRIVSYRISSDREHVDYTAFFEEIKMKVMGLLEEFLHVEKSLKVNMIAVGRYFLPTQETYSEKSFNTANQIVTLGCDLNDVYEGFVEEMKVQAADFQEKDSGMLLYEIYVN